MWLSFQSVGLLWAWMWMRFIQLCFHNIKGESSPRLQTGEGAYFVLWVTVPNELNGQIHSVYRSLVSYIKAVRLLCLVIYNMRSQCLLLNKYCLKQCNTIFNTSQRKWVFMNHAYECFGIYVVKEHCFINTKKDKIYQA